VKGEETIPLDLGAFRAQKIIFELRGRGIVGEETVEIPIRRPGSYWAAKGIGFVRIEDAFDKTWDLTETNLVAK
jgi:hypothetical protein